MRSSMIAARSRGKEVSWDPGSRISGSGPPWPHFSTSAVLSGLPGCHSPARALRAVLDRDAHRRQFLADCVGAREVARGARGAACLDQAFDLRAVDVRACALPEPCFRVLLQQAEPSAAG